MSTLIAATLVALALAGPAAAQGGLLKSLARQAAAAAIQNATQPKAQAAAPVDEASAGTPTQYAAAETAPVTSGPAPWPVNVGAREVKTPGDLAFSSELEAQKKAFVDFSKVRCTDCEGGYSYDAWVRHFVKLDGSYGAWERKVGALAMGETITWKGSQSHGVLTVVGEEPVNGWTCKQLRWALKKDQAAAERPGLFCQGKSGRWSEVF